MAGGQMTPEQALKLMEQVCADFRGTLQDHMALQQALGVLREAIRRADAEPGAPPPAEDGE